MIHLRPEVRSTFGDDTFWEWFNREFEEATFDGTPSEGDVSLVYSTLMPQGKGKHVACCWELYPEMRDQLKSPEWDAKIAKIEQCAKACDLRVVASPLTYDFYARFGETVVVPLGVDMDLFKPMDKQAMRRKHNIEPDAKVAFWCGTMHPMKGYDRVTQFENGLPGVGNEFEVLKIWKNNPVPQRTLAELMNCCDFLLVTGRLRPYFLVEWEAMACDLKVVNVTGLEKDFIPSDHPRDDLIDLGWDRHDVSKAWHELLTSL
jgi:glycosyltransferase involved in cell wall biosynthesis